MRFVFVILLFLSFSLLNADVQQIKEVRRGYIFLDDGSVWKVNDTYNEGVHYNGTLANDPDGLQVGDSVEVVKWYPNATSWQVFDEEGNEIEHPRDLFIFRGDGQHYMTLIQGPKKTRVTKIDFDNQTVRVKGKIYNIRVHPRQVEELEILWRSGDPVIIATDSELELDKPVIVNLINHAVLQTK